MTRRLALVTGYLLHAQALERLMNARSDSWRMRVVDMSVRGLPEALLRLPFADAVVCIGGPGLNPALDVAARALEKPVYVIWAGSDVSAALAQPESTAIIATRGYVHGAVSPWLIRELREAAIEAQLVKIGAVDGNTGIVPFPAAFRVLSYLPESRRSFYGSRRFYELARRFPTIAFHAVGAGMRDPSAPANVHFLGHRSDVSAAIDACVVLVRLTEHDGHSVMVNEALARGRHVIWTNVLPGVQCVETDDEATGVLRALLECHAAGTLAINTAGVSYVRAAYSGAAVVASVESFLQTPAAAGGRQRTRRVAVSGAPQTAARTCELVLSSQSRWNPLLLETSSRIRLLAAMYALAQSDIWYTIGSTCPPRQLRIIATLLHKPRIMHWTAGDITLLADDPALARRLRSRRVVHVASCSATVGALRRIGILASDAPLPIRLPAPKSPRFPVMLTLLLDLASAAIRTADQAPYKRLVDAFAGEPVKFLVLGGTPLGTGCGNTVEYVAARADLEPVYSRCTAVIRFVGDDGGLPLALEALAAGRYVLGSQPFPYTVHVADEAQLERAVRELLERHRSGTLPLNHDGAAFVRREYSAQAVLEKLESIWCRAAAAYGAPPDLALQT